MRATGSPVLWICDPMHGNTETSTSGLKTRRFENIVAKLEAAFRIHRELGSWLGGVHFELTGEDVTECTGGARGLTDADLARAYKSQVDPRLNYEQALELAMRIAGLHSKAKSAKKRIAAYAVYGAASASRPSATPSSHDSQEAPKPVNFRRYSSEVVDGLKQAPSRAMLRAVGYKDADFKKPAIGIASTWSNLTPCNMHIDKLARAAAAAVDKAGGKSTTFGTITVSDGISNGAPGMRYSLVSREVIADSIETVSGAQGFDGVVAIGGCDKNMPGCMMALARLESAFGVRLRRHDPARREASRHHFGVRGARRVRQRHDLRARDERDRAHRDSRARAAARACTRPTPWPRRSKRWA